jgi:hypothetical protein
MNLEDWGGLYVEEALVFGGGASFATTLPKSVPETIS